MKEKLNTLKSFTAILTFFCVLFSCINLSAQCAGLGSVTLNVVAAPDPLLNAPAALCAGASGTVSVTTSFPSYAWNTGGNGQSIAINNPGTFTVTVTNSAGCTGTKSITVAPSPSPTPNVTQNPYACNGQVVLNAGNGFSTYSWSNAGGNSSTATFSSAGLYTVTVTNAAGCTATDDFNVTIPAPPLVNITGALSFCTGLNTTLNATAGFTSYAWSSGGTAPSLSVASAGTYTVTATNSFGCTDTETATVVSNISPVPLVAGGQICPGGIFALNVSNGPFSSYLWNNSSSSSNILVGPGNYTVTVTEANGCTGTVNASVTLFAVPNPVISAAPFTCNGQISLDAGAGFSSYSWSNGAVTPGIPVNNSGVFTVTVTNASGCSGTNSFNVTLPPPPVVSITGSNSFCAGLSTILNASPGLASYNWNTGQNGANISVANGGTFTVTATDNFGCTTTANFTTTSLPSPLPVVAGPATVCSGIAATLNTTAPFVGYNWSNGQSGPSITVTAANTYTVTVTAANGCTGTDSQVLAVTPSPNPVISEANYLCDEQLTLITNGPFNAYSWSNSSNAPSITISASTTFTVTVTNAQGCTGTDIYFAVIPTPPIVDITGNSSICPGTSTILSATPGFSLYQWSNATNTPNITVVASGNYLLTVTDGFGCTTTDAFSVSALPAPAPNISGPSQICASGSATFSVPGTFSNISWSTGVSAPTITVNNPATYTVTVTAANGCTATDTQTLAVSTSLQPQIIESPYLCTGQITLDAGTGFNTYSWDSGQTTQNISVTTDDTYTVTVSDAGGCTGTAAYIVVIPPVPLVAISGNNSICGGTATVLTATAGLNTYIWSTAQVGNTISVSAAGTFTVTATDAFGCSTSGDIVVNTVAAPLPNITGPSVICTNSTGTLALSGAFNVYNWSTGATTATISITTGNTYSVTVTNAAGCTGTDIQIITEATALSPAIVQLPYACNSSQLLDAGVGYTAYLWSGSQTTATASVNSAGTYTVTVTDATGCTGTGTFDVTIPLAPQVAISGNNSFCQNTSTTLNATTGFASYLWTGGTTTNDLLVIGGGVFTVTVTDGSGCTDTESITITAQPLPVPLVAGPATICVGNNATFSLGQNYTSYAWSDGTAGSSITVSVSGTYTVVVTDGNGCTGTDDILLAVNSNPTPAIAVQPYNCDGQIVLSATTGFNAYSWSNSGNTTSVSLSQSGNYTVTVTDVNGCKGSVSQAITVPVLTQVSIAGPLQFCLGGNVDLLASPGFVSYQWSTTASSPGITTATPGVYEVTVTDGLGCKSTATATVSLFATTAPFITGPLAVCPGNTATLSVGGGFTGYSWSTGENTAAITVQPPFTGTVTVTDANGCTGTAATSVVISNQLTPSIAQLPYNCDGQITLDAGVGFSNYSWNTLGNTPSIKVSQSGTYTVTVSDGGGCSGTAAVQVVVPVPAPVTITGDNQLCPAEVSTLTATGGFVNYTWSNTSNTSTALVNAAGTYSVTVTDGQGCTATASIAVVNLPPPAPVITGSSTICGSSPVTLNVNGAFVNIAWSNSSNMQGITVNTAGTYTATVTDANGCTGTASKTLIAGGSITANATVLPYSCDGQLTLDAGTGYAVYSWNNAANTATTSVAQSGVYTVTVSDANGCTGTATVQATIPVAVVPQVYSVPELCPGASITSIVLNQQNYVNFEWNTGLTGPIITGVMGGETYTVTVTDANGCTQTAGFSILLAASPVPVIVPPLYACDNQLKLNAGPGFSTYLWSNNSTTQNITVTQSGTYTVTVSNIAGCTGSGTVQATIPPPPIVAISGASTFCAGSSAIIAANAGFSTYLWSTGGTQVTLFITQSGNYTVTVTNAAGCTATATTSLQATNLSPALQSNEVFCQGTSVTIAVTGIYQGYLWSDGSNQTSLTVVQPGIYTVTVTDAAGCTGTAISQVFAVPPATVNIAVNNVLCGGSASLVTSGSAGSFAWSSGATGSTLAVGQAGTYTVTVTDANGCTATDSANVQPGVPLATTVNRQTCRPQEAGTEILTLLAANGCDSVVTIITAYQPNKPGLELDLGPTLEVKVGQEISFDVVTNFPLDSVLYQSPFILSCSNCFSPTFTATVSGVIGVTAFDPDGCLISDELLVRVNSKIDVFVPNAFQPGSTDNGYLSVFSGAEISFVRNFNVYDRWGNALFSRDDMPTNDPSVGWDGTFRNKKMSPGVYVYYFEVNLADGSTVVYKGDVTIID
jgi:hypothetical protein